MAARWSCQHLNRMCMGRFAGSQARLYAPAAWRRKNSTIGQHQRIHVAATRTAESATAEEPAAAAGLPEVIETSNVPILLYARRSEVEPDALKQLINLAESKLPTGYVSAMPDVHLGKGVTIGTVFASEWAVAPNAVGVDIGCGMCAVPVDGLHKDDVNLEQLLKMQQLVKRRIPTGLNEHATALQGTNVTLDEISHAKPPSRWLEEASARKKVAQQLGTLGGGNHFLELVHDETGRVWIMLHSGSRNIGNITAQQYDGLAKEQLEAQRISMPAGLNYLEIDSEQGRGYLGDMDWCQDYAFHNRRYMLQLMVDSLDASLPGGARPDLSKTINIHHNYCACQACNYQDPRTGEQVSKDLWVTRKGATSAQKGQLGIIPGSMGTGSFIVRGRGEAKSWNSCSHGAGRRMSRTKAKASILQTAFEDAMAGIVCDTDAGVLDEAPQAYKDLSEVMRNQTDLVDVEHRLLPLLNVKGFDKGGKRPRRRRATK